MSHTVISGPRLQTQAQPGGLETWIPRPLVSRAAMTIHGSIDTRYALDITAGAAYEAHSGTAVPIPMPPTQGVTWPSGLRTGH